MGINRVEVMVFPPGVGTHRGPVRRPGIPKHRITLDTCVYDGKPLVGLLCSIIGRRSYQADPSPKGLTNDRCGRRIPTAHMSRLTNKIPKAIPKARSRFENRLIRKTIALMAVSKICTSPPPTAPEGQVYRPIQCTPPVSAMGHREGVTLLR
jgi:hypothetical protein